MMREVRMRFRKARASDINEIAKIIKSDRALRDYTRKYSPEALKQIIKDKNAATYVFADNGNIAAFLELRLESAQRIAYLEAIIVRRRYRRKGIGSLLMSQMEKIARNRKCKRVNFFVRADNPAMNFLARKMRYKQKGNFVFWEKEI